MTITILAPLLAAIIGALIYALASNTKFQELGRITFACGTLVTLFLIATRVIRF